MLLVNVISTDDVTENAPESYLMTPGDTFKMDRLGRSVSIRASCTKYSNPNNVVNTSIR